MIIRINLLTIFCFSITLGFAQSTAQDRIISFEKIVQSDTVLNSIHFRNVGPTIMSGRVTDVEVNPNNTTEMYVAYASGGVWHTTNNGMSFTPIFDNEASITIGDIAVNWKENIIWVGTGECNSSRSSYAGTGVYKSKDGGKNWQHIGLTETQHISRIILHPTDKNTVYVASIGALYTDEKASKGIFKTTDGGQHWNKTSLLNYTDNHQVNAAGVIDLQMDVQNPNTLYACTWQRSRKAWQFDGQGEASAIYKSTDAGENWQCITGSNSGFPKNKGVGRIGIAQCAGKPNIWYALLDNQNRQAEDKLKKNNITALQIKEMNTETFTQVENKKLEDFLRTNGYDEKYTAKSVKEDIKNKKYQVADVANWILSDGDAALFQTPVIGAELYKSNDGGNTWKKTHEKVLEGLYFTYGYYFGTIAVHPTNDNEVYVAGYTVLKTNDAGKTFKEIVKDNCHPDHHRVWINPNNPKHLVLGNDGGINISYDDGEKWYKGNNPAVGQFYAIAVDDAKPYHVYGGLQDNGTWVGPSTNEENDAWHQQGEYAFKEIGGGDGMQVQVDTRDNATVYSGYQFGFYNRSNRNTSDDNLSIHPSFDIGQKPLRYNWQTPIALSIHNQDILYMGSNCFHRSMNKGADMQKLSEDLTASTNKGNVPYGTITSISENPMQFGLIYCGTDDGNIWMSNDVGNSFQKININNKQLWVSRIIASKHKKERVYAALNGYRNDDFGAYLFVSDNYGKTWKAINSNLPVEPINVIREDPKKENIIYVGTDNGLYVSTNNGASFMAWRGALPRVAIHDIAIQERENDIVLGTHGRSIYISSLNNIQLVDSMQQLQFHILPIAKIKEQTNWGSAWAVYAKPNQATIPITFFTKTAGAYTVEILNAKKEVIYTSTQKAVYGFNTFDYHATANKAGNTYKGDDGENYLKAGNYFARIKLSNGNCKEVKFTISAADKKEEKKEEQERD